MVGGIMDVFTILRRNIQKKKGIFICIILLTTPSIAKNAETINVVK